MEPTQTPSQTGQTPNQTPSQSGGQQIAAISAIQSVVPPNPTGGKRTLDSEGRVTTPETKVTSNDEGKTVSLEDFEDESPSSPKAKDTNRLQKSTVEKTEKSSEESTENEGEVDLDKPSDENKLELDINLDEDAVVKKVEQQKQEGVKLARDYSKFKPEHVEELKKLPNHLFSKASDWFLNQYKLENENKELKTKLENQASGKLPESYFEHPRAFELSQQYQEVAGQLEYDNFEEKHWSTQLARVMRKQDWHQLTGYDQNGNPQYKLIKAPQANEDGTPAEIDVDAQLAVQNWLHQVQQMKAGRVGQLNVLKGQHQESFNRSKQGIDGLKQKFFSKFANEAELPLSVKADLTTAKKAFEETAPAFKDNPLTPLVLYSYASLKAQARQIMKLVSMLNKKADGVANASKAGPGKTEFQGGSATPGEKILSASDFDD